MLLCRVLIGDIAQGYRDCEPPLKSDGITRVETLVDDTNNPTIFVSTRDYCALPFYYIWFKERKYHCWAKGCSSRLEYIATNGTYVCSSCCKDSDYIWHCPNTYKDKYITHPHSFGFELCDNCVRLNKNSYWHSRWETIHVVRTLNQHPECWICDSAMKYVLVGSKQLNNGASPVHCDNSACEKNQTICHGYIWHCNCANDENSVHSDGFNLCPDCGFDCKSNGNNNSDENNNDNYDGGDKADEKHNDHDNLGYIRPGTPIPQLPPAATLKPVSPPFLALAPPVVPPTASTGTSRSTPHGANGVGWRTITANTAKTNTTNNVNSANSMGDDNVLPIIHTPVSLNFGQTPPFKWPTSSDRNNDNLKQDSTNLANKTNVINPTSKSVKQNVNFNNSNNSNNFTNNNNNNNRNTITQSQTKQANNKQCFAKMKFQSLKSIPPPLKIDNTKIIPTHCPIMTDSEFTVQETNYDDNDKRHRLYGDGEKLYNLIYYKNDYSGGEYFIQEILSSLYSGCNVSKLLTNIDESTLRCYLGTIYYRYYENYVQSQVEFERAIKLDDKNDLAYYEYGVMLFECDRYIESLKKHKRALELKPNVIAYKMDYNYVSGLIDDLNGARCGRFNYH